MTREDKLIGKPRNGCPWTSRAERDKAALSDNLKRAAARGDWFCCHVRLGTCHGAKLYGVSREADRYR
jgi:hypothetical protein